ncbi:hypothetical protein A9Q89_05490 [Gammaproteobacteria bacterium 53_120_T64]|nr:hypothetical protein A9Q89_05490 [Gammaproteobacteria bacterium 53_120_T64]
MDTSNADSNAPVTETNLEFGDYDFQITAVLSEAWEKTNGLKGSFWAAGAILVLVMLTFGALLGGGGALLAAGGNVSGGMLSSVMLQVAIMAIMYPFMAGIIMLGIHRSVELPLSYTSVFGYFTYTLPLLGVAVLMSILITLGFLLLVIPGIYLSLAYMFAVPLVVEKNLGVWEAMETSRKAVTTHWFKLFFLFLFMGLILVISALPLGIGLIWAYPMMLAMTGVMYREIFGVEVEESFVEESLAEEPLA